MNHKHLITIAFISFLFTLLTAQNSKRTPDRITRTNGDVIACKIHAVDSSQIDFTFYASGNDIRTYLNLDVIAEYEYTGERVILREIETEKIEEIVGDVKPAWKKPGYQLHVNDQPDVVFRLSFMVPGVVFEGRIAQNSTFRVNAWTGMEYSWGNYNGEEYSEFQMYTGITLGPRFYTNLDSRAARGKRVDYYSGTYIDLPGTIVFLGDYNLYQFGALGGFQRTLGRKGYWNISVGLGLTSYAGMMQIGLAGEFGIGVILTK